MEIVVEMGEGKEEVFTVLQSIGTRSASAQNAYKKSDARRWFAGTLGNTLHSYWMILNMLSQQHVPEGEDVRYVELLKFLRGSTFVVFYSNIENCVRAIWAHLQGAPHNTDTFDGVSRGLLKRLDLKQFQNLLDVSRTMRNGVHNAFLYRGKAKTLEWKGLKYDCKDGEPLELFSAQNLHFLFSELWMLVTDILKSSEVLAPEFIDLGVWVEGGTWTKQSKDAAGTG